MNSGAADEVSVEGSRRLAFWSGDSEPEGYHLSRALLSADVEVLRRLRIAPDHLISLGMDLWAQEQGYARVAPGLARI